jgi:peptidoglycan hydrolase-like protein with peptidoglycan-binding domain
MTQAQDVLAVAASQIGTTEWPPESNHVKYSAWYADAVGDHGFASGPWCAMFVSWVFGQVGASDLVAAQTPAGFAYCPSGLKWFASRGATVSTPRAGDVVFFDWEADRVADHVGIVQCLNGDGTLTCIEGNTSAGSVGSQSNGGGVYRRVRPLRLVRGIGRPAYDGAGGPEVVPVLQRGSTGPEVAAWQELLLRWDSGVLGDSGADGDFGPVTEAATRALQAAAGVAADGQVGPVTRAAADRLLAQRAVLGPAPAVPPLGRLLAQGSSGADVKQLQDRLGARGWALVADGEFGPATDSVVRQYQAEKGLAVDGVVGPATWVSVFTAPIT